jgi:hypothetical protein
MSELCSISISDRKTACLPWLFVDPANRRVAIAITKVAPARMMVPIATAPVHQSVANVNVT